MACSPTPETLRHPPLCSDNRPLFGPACGGPQNLAGEVESLSHINRWIAAPGRSAALPSVMVGVVTPAAFTISARGAVVVFAREKLDRATARRGPRYSVAFFVTFFCTGGAGSVTAGAAADFVASCASAGAIAVAAGTAKPLCRQAAVSSQYRTGWPQSAPRGGLAVEAANVAPRAAGDMREGVDTTWPGRASVRAATESSPSPRWRSFVGDRLYSARIGGSSVSSPPADRLAGT
jgi:hypothetical protein